MLLIFFQTAQNIDLSQVNASCLSPVGFFSLFNSQLIPNFKNMVYSQVNDACVSRPNFSYSLIPNLFRNEKTLCFHRYMLHAFLVPLFLITYSLTHNLFQNAKNMMFSQVHAACLFRPIFFRLPNSRLVGLTRPCQWILQLEQRETAPTFKKRKQHVTNDMIQQREEKMGRETDGRHT